MAYTYERPDLKALDELEQLLRHVGEELAGWRRRTLRPRRSCRRRRPAAECWPGPELKEARQRVIELETENQALRQRIEAAKERLEAAGRAALVPGAARGRERGVSTATKNAVRVTIGGEEYTVRSELPPEYTREVAAYLDAALKRVRDSLPMVETHKAAILAGARDHRRAVPGPPGRPRASPTALTAMADELARLLPPAKRGKRAAAS